MSPSRYRQARTLVRRLCRLPEQPPADFKQNIARLRDHFERFNVDTSELCQWFMGLRKQYGDPDSPAGFGLVGDFLLEPHLDNLQPDEPERDRWRLAVFDQIAKIRKVNELAGHPLPKNLLAALDQVAAQTQTPTAHHLFDRLRTLEPAHRLVLLKAAAEWIVARYQRGVENWVRHHAEWQKEKDEWERRHPTLTEEIRDRFTDLFKQLNDPERGDKPGIRRKKPRICPYDRMKPNLNNCIYAGQKGHGPLCWKYVDFVKDRKAKNQRFNEKHFGDNAADYLAFRAGGNTHRIALDRLFKKEPKCRPWFNLAWPEYLRFMNLNEQTVVQQGQLPHCRKIGQTFENSNCQWNPHTHLCLQYKRALAQLDDATIQLEPLYRQWRAEFLAGPRKPSFKYPSTRELPMPKIFGDRFHQIDFDRSVLRLRLDDMAAEQWLEFAFIPWPKGYRPSKKDVQVTSVHVNFVGTRARAGFRFDVPHENSPFACTQDELDELRSRQFPRPAQDQEFLNAARQRLIDSFPGNPDADLRLLAVDLGETGAHAAVYQGRTHERDIPLPIVKINKAYTSLPEKLEKNPRDTKMRGSLDLPKDDPRGLRKEHTAQHLKTIADGAAKLAERRQPDVPDTVTLQDHDFRGLKRHITWMIRDWARHNAAQIVAAAEQHRCHLIVFESLRNFKAPGYDKMDPDKKRRLAMFAYGRIRRKVVEKAVERGMRVVTAPYFKSSQFCSACGHEQLNKGLWRKNKSNAQFHCECGDSRAQTAKAQSAQQPSPQSDSSKPKPKCACTARLNSDANAARVLARVFWDEIHLPTRRPESASRP
jgi:hypothetical protein